MNKMNKDVLEGNKLIAEFMGAEFGNHDDQPQKHWLFPDDLDGPHNTVPGYIFNHNLKFHESWDWLIPVLAKIGSKTGQELVIHSETSYWNQFGDNALLFDFLGYEYPLQDGIWKAVVEFIKWYNENNKTNDYAGINY